VDAVHGEAAAAPVLTDQILAGGVVDAEELVVDQVAVDPLDLGTELAQDLDGLLGQVAAGIGVESADLDRTSTLALVAAEPDPRAPTAKRRIPTTPPGACGPTQPAARSTRWRSMRCRAQADSRSAAAGQEVPPASPPG
jgi:hypothetical protein